MSYSKNVIRGAKARDSGDYFEAELSRQAIIDGIGFEKIPSGCRWVNSPKGLKAIGVKTPFDFMMFKNGRAIFFDAKSTDGNTFPHSKLEEHQVKSLAQIASHGFKCGYLVKFVGIGFTWFPVEKLLKLNPRESLKPIDGISLVTEAGSFTLMSLFL